MTNADHSIDTVLTGLRNTTAPTNLEARIHARLAQAETCEPRPDRFTAVILSIAKDPRILLGSPIRLASASAAIACVAIVLIITFTHHPHSQPSTNFASQPTTTGALASTTAKTRVAPRFSAGSHRDSVEIQGALAPDPNDPDAIALAETLAPSHPAPPLPLTAQEALLLRSTRPGQPIEVAELDSARAALPHPLPAPHERTTIDIYIHAMLQPLAAAEALSPTPPDEPTSSGSIDPPSSK